MRILNFLVSLFTLATVLLVSDHAAAQEELPKEGLFASGIGVIPVSLGPIQAFSKGGHALGLRLAAGAQIDLGPRWAVRVPVVIAGASGGSLSDYVEIDVVPGVLYRFRDRVNEGFTPYVGAGVKLGGFGADRPLLGKPVVAVLRPAVSRNDLFDEHHHSDPNFDAAASIGAELWAGGSWHASRLLSLDFDLTGAFVPVDGALIAVVAETAALRFTF
jgi:hypothetical protein